MLRSSYVKVLFTIILSLFLANTKALAESLADADVTYVKAINEGEKGWTFHVTVLHPDTGWEDYCNGWDVVTEQGMVLKRSSEDSFTRLLYHPHENEQPFTRSQSRLKIPAGVKSVTVRAHDLLHGFGGKEITLNLSTNKGPGYEINQ